MKNLVLARVVAPFAVLCLASTGCLLLDDDGPGGSGGEAVGGEGAGAAPTGASSPGGNGSGAGEQGGNGTGASSTGAGNEGGSSEGGGSQGGSSQGGGSPGSGWTIVPLIDDDSDPDFGTQVRAGIDLVSGIHYASLDDGYLVTRSTQNGGAVFKATQSEVTEVNFGGRIRPYCSIYDFINYWGIERTQDGYIALSNACGLVSSSDGGASFGLESNGEPLALEPLFAVRPHGSEYLAISDDYVATTPAAPGPTASWDYVWAPEASPSVPNPIPTGQCHNGPYFTTAGLTSAIAVGADGSRIAYGSLEDGETVICVSDDAGRSFFPSYVPVNDGAQGNAPDGVIFTNDLEGIAWYSNYVVAGSQWLARTTDGGSSWTPVDFPPELASMSIELRNGFFAPDGQHGWIVGYDYDAAASLLLKTSDGGASFQVSGGDLADKVEAAGGGKLHSGFALDANHIWVGGELGIFASNGSGGE